MTPPTGVFTIVAISFLWTYIMMAQIRESAGSGSAEATTVGTVKSNTVDCQNCTQNDMSRCTSPWVCLEKQLEQGVVPVEILSRVKEHLVRVRQNIHGGDINRSIRLLGRLMDAQERRFSKNSQQMRKEEAVGFAKTMITCGNVLLNERTNSAWRSIPENRWSEVTSGILDSSERAAILLARVVPEETHWIAKENIVMAIKNGTTGPATFPDLGTSSLWTKVKDGITLPRTEHHVISAIYRNVGRYLKPKNRTVNSRIISATLVNTTLVNGNSTTGPSIDGNVTIVLEHTEQTSNGSTLCVFWDVFHGNWSDEGCTKATTNTTHTICECNHLTSFAILMDTTGQQGNGNGNSQGNGNGNSQGNGNGNSQGNGNGNSQGNGNGNSQGNGNGNSQGNGNGNSQGNGNRNSQGNGTDNSQGNGNGNSQGNGNGNSQGNGNGNSQKGIDQEICTQNETSQQPSRWVCDFENQRKQGVSPVEILSRVRERLVNATENIRGGDVDIHRSIRLLSRLVEDQERRFSNNSQQMKKEEAIRFAETMISIGNALLKNHTDSAWRSIPEDRRSEVASGILDSSERAAILLARVVPYKTHWIANENIVMAIKNGTTAPATFPDLGKSSFWADVKDGITLPRTQHHVISAIYSNIGQYFKPKSVNRTVNSRIISATLVNTTLVNGNSTTGPSIDGNVTIFLEHTEQTSNGSTLCVFWDVFHGNWSGEGCTTATTNTTHTICECNHLTSFAILVDTTGQHSTIGEQHSFALSVITYIGCIISIVCLFFCICVFLGFRRVRCTRTIIHANLCICLLAAEVVFLVAVDKTENAVVCDAIAILLHYLFLAVFTWMCVEGVELYVLLVKVFNLKMNRLIYYHLVGYGAPALVVATSVTYNYFVEVEDELHDDNEGNDGYFDGYGTGTYCWLSVKSYFIWSFVGPMLIVVLVNIGFLAMTMKVIYTQKAHDRSNQSEQGMEFKFWIRVSLALVCILGLTWVFGVLYISSETLVFAYVFTVINSLQGLFIFIFHCLLNEMVQDEIERRFGVQCPCWSKKKRQKTVKRQTRRTARAPQQQEIWLGDFTDTKDSHSSTHGSLQTNMSSEDTLDKLDDEGFEEDGAGTEGSVDNVI